MEVINIILPIVYIVVGCLLVWFIVELVITIRKARNTVTDLQQKLEPTLDNVQRISAGVEPLIKKVDPMMDRVNLTVDAANLEIMRLDQVMEDMKKITGSVANTLDTVDTVTSAPLDLVASVTDKVRKRFRPRYASKESEKLGEGQKAGAAKEAEKLGDGQKSGSEVVHELVDEASDAAANAAVEIHDNLKDLGK